LNRDIRTGEHVIEAYHVDAPEKAQRRQPEVSTSQQIVGQEVFEGTEQT
jgi:hypothetical protein